MVLFVELVHAKNLRGGIEMETIKDMPKESQKQFRYFVADMQLYYKRKFTRKEIKLMREAWIASEMNKEADIIFTEALDFAKKKLNHLQKSFGMKKDDIKRS